MLDLAIIYGEKPQPTKTNPLYYVTDYGLEEAILNDVEVIHMLCLLGGRYDTEMQAFLFPEDVWNFLHVQGAFDLKGNEWVRITNYPDPDQRWIDLWNGAKGEICDKIRRLMYCAQYPCGTFRFGGPFRFGGRGK